MNKPLIRSYLHHNGPERNSQYRFPSSSSTNNNPGAVLPAATIPVLSVRAHLLLLFYAVCLYNRNIIGG